MRAGTLIILIAALAAGITAWLLRDPSPVPVATSASSDATNKSSAGPEAVTTTTSSTPTTSATVPTTSAAAPTHSQPDYRRLLNDSTDLLPLMQTLHTRAEAGDAAAMYWLWAAGPVCGLEYDELFTIDADEPGALTLDEALQQHASNPRVNQDELRQTFQKCRRLREAGGLDQFGNGRRWLAESAERGYPLAQVVLAGEELRRYEIATSPQTIEKKQQLKTLARTGLMNSNGDPEVVRQAARVAASLTPESYELSNRRVRTWVLAACLRGADCTQRATWVRQSCQWDTACQPFEDATDIIRRESGSEYVEIERRAREINALIDAKAWDDLEFE